MRRLALGLLLALAAVPAQAAATLTEPAVRAFVARQERAWTRRDIAGFFATFAPGAVFVDQARTAKGELIPYGSATAPQARAQVRRFFAASTFTETVTAPRVILAPDGRSARVLGRKTTTITTRARGARTLCAETEQTIVLAAGRLASQGQIETAVRCAR